MHHRALLPGGESTGDCENNAHHLAEHGLDTHDPVGRRREGGREGGREGRNEMSEYCIPFMLLLLLGVHPHPSLPPSLPTYLPRQANPVQEGLDLRDATPCCHGLDQDGQIGKEHVQGIEEEVGEERASKDTCSGCLLRDQAWGREGGREGGRGGGG